jgi:hypothetical protein
MWCEAWVDLHDVGESGQVDLLGRDLVAFPSVGPSCKVPDCTGNLAARARGEFWHEAVGDARVSVLDNNVRCLLLKQNVVKDLQVLPSRTLRWYHRICIEAVLRIDIMYAMLCTYP